MRERIVMNDIFALTDEFYNLIKDAKHKYKRKYDTENTTIYEYSEKHVQERNKKKAQHIEKLRNSISKLRSQYKKDLKSEDQDTFQTALAIALIDETAERIGNAESAESGHFGVTVWKKKHINFSGGKAKINYVGKSGVKQSKVVENSQVISALKKLWKEAENGNSRIFTAGRIALKINAYLKPFGITAKDLRGMHANQLFLNELKKLHKGKLPTDEKEKTKELKERFNEALEETCKELGNTPGVTRRQYLSPGIEEKYLKDGTIVKKFAKSEYELSGDEFVYHVTFFKNLDNISVNGLNVGDGSAMGRGGYKSHSGNKLFFTSMIGLGYWFDILEQHAVDLSDNPFEDQLVPVVLRFFKPENTNSDPASGFEESFFVNSSVEPEDIEIWNGVSWIPISDYENIDISQSFTEDIVDEDIFYTFKYQNQNPLLPGK